MYTAVIVDDETLILDLMKIVIGRSGGFLIQDTFSDPMEALNSLPELKPDIVFLDVEMPEMSGMELAEQIRSLMEHTQIVFTTAHRKYSLDAFDVQALDYILKPVTDEAIERVRKRLMKQLGGPDTSSSVNRASYSIRCFGAFEIREMRGTPVHFPTRKTEELLAYFLCHPGREINKWVLAEMLWPDMDGDRASHNLHMTIYRLKKVLKTNGIPMEMLKTNDGYELDTGNNPYDVLAFLQAEPLKNLETFDHVEGPKLLSHYQGALLEGKPYVWKVALEERFRREYQRLVIRFVSRYLQSGELQQGEQLVYACLNVEPLQAEFHQQLFELYKEAGYSQYISHHYSRLKHVYRDHLGLDSSQ